MHVIEAITWGWHVTRYVRVTCALRARNALRAARNALRAARNALRAYYVRVTCPLRARNRLWGFLVVVVLTVTNGKKPLQMRI